MKREVSLYLDTLRFLAAFAVFVQHFAWQHFSGGLFWQIGPFGAQAVIVFFVLSGYLIGYVTDRESTTARGYALDRAARIYSVRRPRGPEKGRKKARRRGLGALACRVYLAADAGTGVGVPDASAA